MDDRLRVTWGNSIGALGADIRAVTYTFVQCLARSLLENLQNRSLSLVRSATLLVVVLGLLHVFDLDVLPLPLQPG